MLFFRNLILFALFSSSFAAFGGCKDDIDVLSITAPSKETPQSFFAHSQIEGRSRFVLTVGVPGSGKSFWTNHAESNGWVIINPDSIRVKIATEKAARNEKIKLRTGEMVVPDPKNPLHVFSINREAFKEAEELLAQAFRQGKSVVWDATSTTRSRAALLIAARRQSYLTEALVFQTPDVRFNSQNIEKRASPGGLDLATGPDREEKRLKLLQSFKDQMDAEPISVSESFVNVVPTGVDEAKLEKERSHFHLNDFVNRAIYIQVRDYSR